MSPGGTSEASLTLEEVCWAWTAASAMLLSVWIICTSAKQHKTSQIKDTMLLWREKSAPPHTLSLSDSERAVIRLFGWLRLRCDCLTSCWPSAGVQVLSQSDPYTGSHLTLDGGQVWVFASEWLAGHFLAHVLELKNVIREGESRYLSADSFHLVKMSEIIKVTPSNREPWCKCSYPAGFTRWCQPERGEIRLTHAADRGREWKWVLITICDHSFSWCHDHRLYNRTQPYFDHFHFSYLEPGWSFQLMRAAAWSIACLQLVQSFTLRNSMFYTQFSSVMYFMLWSKILLLTTLMSVSILKLIMW